MTDDPVPASCREPSPQRGGSCADQRKPTPSSMQFRAAKNDGEMRRAPTDSPTHNPLPYLTVSFPSMPPSRCPATVQ